MTPPVEGADLRAALEASCLRGALPPVDLPAVLLVMCCEDVRCDEVMRKDRQGRDVQCEGGGYNQKAATATPKRCTDDASDAVDVVMVVMM